MNDVAVRVDGVSKTFRLYHERNQTIKSAIMRRRTAVYEDFWALRDVTFDVPRGSAFALVGANGSGKSTLLKCLAKIYYPNAGKIEHFGRMAAMLEVGSGFHLELSGRENIYLNGAILGMSRKEIDAKFDAIVDFSGVEQFIDQPVKNYSSGMFVRLGFSIAIHVDPEILVVDEVLAVGDAEFQEKCFQKFRDFRKEGGTVILVSHATDTVLGMCDYGAWLNRGVVGAVGTAEEAVTAYLASVPPAVSDDED